MMRRLLQVVILGGVLGIFASTAAADVQGRDFGLGIAIGEPSGITMKKWVGPSNAFDVHIGFGAAWDRRLRIHADYLWHWELHDSTVRLDLYLGVGPKVGVYGLGHSWGSALTIGGRVPVGLSLIPADVPIDAFLEVAPGIRFVTRSGVGAGAFVDGLIGVRYYF